MHTSRIHEAGHCVACLAVGAEVERVVVYASGAGETFWLSEGIDSLSVAAVRLAGIFAEIRLAGVPSDVAMRHSGRDLERVGDLKLDASDRQQAMRLADAIVTHEAAAVHRLADLLAVHPVIMGEDVSVILADVRPVFSSERTSR